MRFARFITEHPALVLVAAILLAIPAAVGFMMTQVNYDLLTYLPSRLDSMQGESILDKDFGDATLSILLLERMSLKDVSSLEVRIARIPGVAAVLSPADVIPPSLPREFLPDSIRGKLDVDDSTLLVVKYSGSGTSKETQDAIARIRAEGGRQCFVSGASVVLKDTKDLVDGETPVYVAIAVALSVIALALTMESFLIPFVFLFEIALAILYNFGTNFVFGQISYVTKALAAVLQLGVTMDFSIFLLGRYEEERALVGDRREAMAQAMRKTFLTISAGALTEMAGFLSLCAMSLGIGSDIGMVMAKGVFLGLVGTMTVLPAAILALDGPIHRFRHELALPTFDRTSSFVARRYKPLCVLFLALLCPAFYGDTNVKQYYNVMESMPKDLPSIVANDKLASEYGMTSSHFILLPSDLGGARKARLAGRIAKVDGVESVLSMEGITGSSMPEEFLPDSIRGIFVQAGHELLVANSSYKTSSPEGDRQVDELRAIVADAGPDAHLTGEGALARDLVQVATADFKRVDYVSIGVVFAIIALLFASISVPVIMVGSIELSILINLAIPFYMGETIPFIARIVIGCIQLGVTIDYAILLAMRYREEIRKGLERIDAMRAAVRSSGRLIVTSALTLFSATFGVGLVSRMALLSTLCMMIARGAVISMLVILLVMPALFVGGEKIIARTSIGWARTRKGVEE